MKDRWKGNIIFYNSVRMMVLVWSVQIVQTNLCLHRHTNNHPCGSGCVFTILQAHVTYRCWS